MDAATMTKQVAERATIERDDARRAIEATLRTLAQRVTGPEADDVAAQLPVDFQAVIEEAAAASEQGEAFGADEFVRRVGEQMEADEQTAHRAVQAVFESLSRAVSSGEWGDLLSQLPNEYEPLFPGRGPTPYSG